MSTTAAAVTKARESPYVLALAAKAVLTSVVERRWSLRMLCSSGGMPSSHSALCTALTASVALCHGVGDALFPVCHGRQAPRRDAGRGEGGGLNGRQAGAGSCATWKLEDPGTAETDTMHSTRHLRSCLSLFSDVIISCAWVLLEED